ncbi:MAG: Dabb family protein [Myxococcota bacterium]
MTHVVFFRFPDLEVAREAAARLRSLEGRVPTLASIEVGVDELRTQRSWDVCLITRFADLAGMEAYQEHPAHLEVAAYIRAHAVGAAAVDWTD